MENKRHHFVPKSYFEAWCDPKTPPGQTPYVWLHAADGSEKKPKGPKNILCEPDYYTFYLPDGGRDLFVENYLGSVESHFPRIRDNLCALRRVPDGEDLELLCLYVALMLNRTKKQRENHLGSFQRKHDKVVRMEEAHNAPPSTSIQTGLMAKYGHHFMMLQSLESILEYLRIMSKAILFCAGEARFITSDHPAFLYNPTAYKLPPLYRSTGFGAKEAVLYFPLSPEASFMATWQNDIEGPITVLHECVQEMNRLTLSKCHKNFVTHNGFVSDRWFDPGVEPEDSWRKLQERRHGSTPPTAGRP